MRLGPVVEAAVEAVRPAAADRRLRLATRIESPDALVMGDADRLRQIVWSLLPNAIEFPLEGGAIELSLVEGGGRATIVVKDDGKRIAPDLLPRIFDRFQQGDSSTTRRTGGLELGLAIVRHLVERHGGRVTAESEGEGKGATFTVDLPLADLSVTGAPRAGGARRRRCRRGSSTARAS